MDDHQIPLFLRAEQSGQFDSLAKRNAVLRDVRSDEKLADEVDKPVHLLAAGDRAPGSAISILGVALASRLLLAGTPKVPDRLSETRVKVAHSHELE